MSNRELIVDYPAYALYRMPDFRQANMLDGMEFGMPFESSRYGTQYHFFKIGSVLGSVLERGGDPYAAVERAKANGHELHFVYGLSVSITAHKRDKEEKFALAWGDVIGFHGKRFRLEKAPNQNVRLVEAETE